MLVYSINLNSHFENNNKNFRSTKLLCITRILPVTPHKHQRKLNNNLVTIV